MDHFRAIVKCKTCGRPLAEARHVPASDVQAAVEAVSQRAFCDGHSRNHHLTFDWKTDVELPPVEVEANTVPEKIAVLDAEESLDAEIASEVAKMSMDVAPPSAVMASANGAAH